MKPSSLLFVFVFAPAFVVLACGGEAASSGDGAPATTAPPASSSPAPAAPSASSSSAASCVAVGGAGCFQACAGSYVMISKTACGGGLFCCAESLRPPPLDAGADTGAACTGTAPLCFGANASVCCGRDPAGSAQCVSGAWMCGSAPAPGCSGPCDGG
jgi:hypothetical protein